MKLKCVKNTYESGIFSKKESKCKLTVGRLYEGTIMPRVITGRMHREVDKDDMVVLLFNDKKEWQIYPLSIFIPLFGGEVE